MLPIARVCGRAIRSVRYRT